jgi:uncharacterized protein
MVRFYTIVRARLTGTGPIAFDAAVKLRSAAGIVMKEALVVFAKAPIVGQVKTRLIGALTPEQVTELYVCFLQDTFAMMEAVQAEREQLSLVLCYTPADELEAFEAADLEGCLMLAQQGQDLGERLQNCFADLFAAGFHSIVILGADSPTLPDEIVIEAFDRLMQSGAIVIGPSTDGGYYLVGSNQAQPELFAQINWGSETVLAQTEVRAAALKLDVSRLPEWNDVDTPADLEIMQAQIASGEATSPKTSKYLKKLQAKR